MHRLLLGLLLAAVLLSGCSNDAPPKSPTGLEGRLDDVEVETTETQGGIRGVVVDAAIRPIAGASVMSTDGALSSTTAEDGLFTFDRLEPGSYFFLVAAPRFLPVQTSVDVAAGKVASLRVQLQDNLTPVPYHETFVKEGFIQYGASIATFAANLVVQEANQSICNCYIQFDTAPGAVAIVVEATWDAAVACPPGTSDDMYYQVYEGDTEDIHIASAFQANPIYAVIDKVEMWGENQTSFEASVTEGADCPRYNQQYQSYYTVWYLDFPPEGWSIVAGNV